jgi:hypothetical protein
LLPGTAPCRELAVRRKVFNESKDLILDRKVITQRLAIFNVIRTSFRSQSKQLGLPLQNPSANKFNSLSNKKKAESDKENHHHLIVFRKKAQQKVFFLFTIRS